jgi:hypothetical protein
MKFKVFAITLMILLLSSFVLAEENVGVTATADTSIDLNSVLEKAIDTETKNQIKLMQESNTGAEVRILQLQESALKSLLIGEETINLLSLREDTNEIEAILGEIALIKDEAFMLDANSETTVEEFVAVKRDLVNAVADFRVAVAGKLNSEEKDYIKTSISNNQELEELRNTIRNRIRNVNSQRINRILQKMNTENKELIEKISNGDVNSSEIKNSLKQTYIEMDDETKLRIKNEIQVEVQARVRKNIQKEEQIIDNYLNVAKNRIENRLEQLNPEQKEFLEEKKQLEINQIQRVQEELEIRNEKLSQITQSKINEKSQIEGGNSQ